MAYSPNIPQSTDDPSQSQPLILANFQEISTAFNLNHGNFNGASQGKHEFLQMPEQSSAPTTAASEGALYTKDSGTQPELFWRDESNGTEWQITNQATQTTNGSMLMPGGLLMQWGQEAINISGTITFPVTYSSAVYSIQLTVESSSGVRYASSRTITTADFVAILDTTVARTVHWFAIGV